MKSLINYILESQQVKLDSDGKENGFDYVDLGLPSGTMWATCNVGADKPEDYGLLFQCGRTDGYKYGDRNNKFSIIEENGRYEYDNATTLITSGTEYKPGQILNLKDDAVHVTMGGDWVMPTYKDIYELYSKTTHKVVKINGKEGMLFTSKSNGKSIFVVFAGYWNCFNGQFYSSGSNGFLWSSEVNSYNPGYTWLLYFNSDGNCDISYSSSASGYSVRGILKK